MEVYSLKDKDKAFYSKKIGLHNIVFSVTSNKDYEMERYFLLEGLEDLKYNEYVIVEGFHCSCYDFDDTNWEAIKCTTEELIKLSSEKLKFVTGKEKEFYLLVYNYLTDFCW